MALQVENLENLRHLKELYLGRWKEKNNKIEFFCSSPSEYKYLINSGKNKITKMEGMETLIDLKILSIQVF